jgi:hypothetical protein
MISTHREVGICSCNFAAKIKTLLPSTRCAGVNRIPSPKNTAEAGFVGKIGQLGDRVRAT